MDVSFQTKFLVAVNTRDVVRLLATYRPTHLKNSIAKIVEQHTRDKWLIHGTKQRKDNQYVTKPETPSWEWQQVKSNILIDGPRNETSLGGV